MGNFFGELYSQSLNMTTQVRVIVPDASGDVDPVVSGEPAVLYLLHGLAANCSEWTRFSKIEYYAKKYNLVVIMPEVNRSFYCKTTYGMDYLTYVADELPQLCAKWFNITGAREHTFIAGESMGGYGALKVALRRPQQYAAVASLSGVTDFTAFMDEALQGKNDIFCPAAAKTLLGADGAVKPEDDVISLACSAAADPKRPRLIQFCGTEDFLYGQNAKFKAALSAAGYGHTYMEWPGGHEWPFWDVAIQRAIQFFLGFDLEQTPIY